MKKTSFLLILGIAVLVLTGAYTGYSFWQKSVAGADLKKVEKNLADYQNQVLQFENQQVTQAIAAKQTVNTLKNDMIEWSKVIKKVRSTIPKNKGVPLVDILSYSASSNDTVSMNVKTFPGVEEPYFDVADLIQSFDEESAFAEAFVPSISAGLDDEGREILTFLFSMKYVGESVEKVLEKEVKAVEEPVEEPVIR